MQATNDTAPNSAGSFSALSGLMLSKPLLPVSPLHIIPSCCMTWSRNPFKIPQLFSKQGNSCEPPVSSLFYEMMRLEYQNHGRVLCLTVDTFGYPPSLHRQSRYSSTESTHSAQSTYRYSNNITKIDVPWRLLFTKYTFLQLPLLWRDQSSQFKQN